MELGLGSLAKTTKSAEASKFIAVLPSVVSIVVSLVVIGLVVWPKFSEVLKLKDANKQLEISLSSLETKAQKLTGLNKSTLKSQLGQAELLLPSNKNIFSALAQIENAAATSGIIVDKLDVAPGAVSAYAAPTGDAAPTGAVAPGAGGLPEEQNLASDIPVRITVTGNYKSILQFIDTMQKHSRIVELKDLTLSVGQGDGSSSVSQITTSFTLHVYWQQIPTELVAIDAPVEDLSAEESAVLARVSFEEEESLAPVEIPQVPLGRADLFAPF